MPLQATSGAASYDAFGGGVAAVPQYIEDVFSTWLYTGGSGPQTITNGIDLAGKGGLVWIKGRGNVIDHALWDSNRGVGQFLNTNTTSANIAYGSGITAFNSNGFSLGNDAVYDVCNTSYANPFASWTFRKQPKFFDVVTWTGTGTVSHNLGSTPGFWVYKNTGATGNWFALARKSDGTYEALYLNQTSATVYTGANAAAVGLTSTTFDPSLVFGSAAGQSYVGYAFAHNAGGFGLTGTDNVISCGSYTTNSSAVASVTLGYEPQWLLIKRTDAGGFNWEIRDVMRGYSMTGSQALAPNSSAAEYDSTGTLFYPTATGFVDNGSQAANATFIYIAIRRGPMKVPTSGTSVFMPAATRAATGGTSSTLAFTSNFPVDMFFQMDRNGAGLAQLVGDRLRGSNWLQTAATSAEFSSTWKFDSNKGVYPAETLSDTSQWGAEMFRRAPSFFDEVCYTGSSSTQTVTHNLGVAPELIIVKKRSGGTARGWAVYPNDPLKRLILNSDVAASFDQSYWNDTAATSSVFTVASSDAVNGSGFTFVAYLFATCAGVSKVGSYTGTDALQTINCGFTSGARFVLIKKTSGAGDWYVWDTARGIGSGNDPYLLLNTTAAEVTASNDIGPSSTGFEIPATSFLNVTGATYIFLAIA